MNFKITARTSALYATICVAAVFATYSPSADAQACSAADDRIRTQYQEASLNALMSGDLDRYRNLQQSLPRELSSSCRSRLDELEPMRTRCTAQEKNEVLGHIDAVVQAAQNNNVMLIFDYMKRLEATVSSQCWLAVNRHTDPRVVRACTGAELDDIASFAGLMMRATREMLSTFNMMPLLQHTQNLIARLSQQCQSAIGQFQQQAQQAQNQSRIYGPSSILDHGGGGLIVYRGRAPAHLLVAWHSDYSFVDRPMDRRVTAIS